ncbi:MAG: hypothetical protein HKN92_05115 [Chitinophagales bacterium]|nr:hypothetical protein [Chitinophagales bacterium]
MNLDLISFKHLYLVFYLVGFTAAFAIIYFNFLKRRKDIAFHSLITAAVFLAFVIGSKLIGILESLIFPETYGTSGLQMALGGVVLSFLVIHLIRLTSGVSEGFMFSVGLGILVGLAIQKPGCLFGGCCYGDLARAPFDFFALNGEARHPLQLYEFLLYTLSVVAFIKIKTHRLSSKYYLAIFLYGVIQFTAEFLKAPDAVLAFGQQWYGIRIIQWIYIAVSAATFFMYYKNERRNAEWSIRCNIFSSIFMLTIISTVFLLIHPYLFSIEIYAINLVLLPAVLLTASRAIKPIIPLRRQISYLGLLSLPLLLMSQTVITEEDKKAQEVFHTIRIGYSGGKFNSRVIHDRNPDDCEFQAQDFKQKYNLISIGYGVTKKRVDHDFSFGLNFTYGNSEETRDSVISAAHTIASFNPYIFGESEWVGGGLGLHIGSNSYTLPKRIFNKDGYPKISLGNSNIWPQAHLRLFPKHILAIEYNFSNRFPSPFTGYMHDIAIGSGFGQRNDLFIKLGGVFGSTGGGYVSAFAPIKRRYIIEPLIGFGGLKGTYMIGAHYRFRNRESVVKWKM